VQQIVVRTESKEAEKSHALRPSVVCRGAQRLPNPDWRNSC
jgi:hypothetical protein